MYECYLESHKNGLTDIDIELNKEQFISNEPPEHQQPTDSRFQHDKSAVTITFTFAVFTDGLGMLTVDGTGRVTTAFGGTGMCERERDEYAEQAVKIWREITGDYETTCRYQLREDETDEQYHTEHIIEA